MKRTLSVGNFDLVESHFIREVDYFVSTYGIDEPRVTFQHHNHMGAFILSCNNPKDIT